MFKYNESIPFDSIPVVSADDLRKDVVARCRDGWRVHAFMGLPEWEGASLLCILGRDGTGELDAVRSEPVSSYQSLTPECPQVHLFEREIFEQWGIRPKGHPWLKPVRFIQHEGLGRRHGPAETKYYKVKGSEVHEVAVGPVHAGVIEPGHFRFQCYGENVMHLEIQLGFQHRDVERLVMENHVGRCVPLMENVAGDTAVGHCTAYCTVLERLWEMEVPTRAHVIRRLALEFERLANHTRDLGAIAGDTGFLPSSAWNGRITGDFLNLTAELCGSRFGRGLLWPGGTRWDVDPALAHELVPRLRAAYRDARGSVDVMLATPSVLGRLHGTGVVSKEAAVDLGLVGMAARACGVDMDCRRDWPLFTPISRAITTRVEHTGDVYARTMVRSHELDDAALGAERDLNRLSDGLAESPVLSGPLPKRLPADRLAVALVEGWRGEICHVGVTDRHGAWKAYKVVDPSFHNWMGLSMALRDQQISDFPLCNKSFNLSYCGHDL